MQCYKFRNLILTFWSRDKCFFLLTLLESAHHITRKCTPNIGNYQSLGLCVFFLNFYPAGAGELPKVGEEQEILLKWLFWVFSGLFWICCRATELNGSLMKLFLLNSVSLQVSEKCILYRWSVHLFLGNFSRNVKNKVKNTKKKPQISIKKDFFSIFSYINKKFYPPKKVYLILL